MGAATPGIMAPVPPSAQVPTLKTTMKRRYSSITSAVAVLLIAAPLYAGVGKPVMILPAAPCPLCTPQAGEGTLDETESDALVYIREEEKLARDTFQAAADQWQAPIFGNIASTKLRHGEADADGQAGGTRQAPFLPSSQG